MIDAIFKALVSGLEEGKESEKKAIYTAVKDLGVKQYEVFENGLGLQLDQLTIGSREYRTAFKLYADTAVFTAAKVNAFARQYGRLSDPIEKATLAARHAGVWHKAETIALHRNAQQARKWLEYEEQADLYPHLIYDAILDGRTRMAHRKMDGIILPLPHPFWDTHFPPNGYGCRCDVHQSSETPTPEKQVNTKKRQAYVPPVFKNNSAKSGTLFQKHPYQGLAENLTGNDLEVFKKSPNRAMTAFLAGKKDRIKAQKINKKITYTDTTTKENTRIEEKMTIIATRDFLNEMRGQPATDQLLMLNWSQWLNMEEVSIRKVPVRASQKGKGRIKFETFFVAETEEVSMRLGKKIQKNEIQMYHMAKKRK